MHGIVEVLYIFRLDRLERPVLRTARSVLFAVIRLSEKLSDWEVQGVFRERSEDYIVIERVEAYSMSEAQRLLQSAFCLVGQRSFRPGSNL